MTDVRLPFDDPPDGYALEITRQRNEWQVVARTHDPLLGRWMVVLDLTSLSWSDALEAAYTTLWGFAPGRARATSRSR